jgi:hypothetical protein
MRAVRKDGKMFLRNGWYTAVWSHELRTSRSQRLFLTIRSSYFATLAARSAPCRIAAATALRRSRSVRFQANIWPAVITAGNFEGNVDRWQFATWHPAGIVYLDVGCAKAGTGAPQGDRSQGISIWSSHLITPETERSTHYMFCFARAPPVIRRGLYDDHASLKGRWFVAEKY